MNLEKKKLIKSLKTDLTNNPLESSAPVYQPIYFDEFKDIKTSLNKNNFYKKFGLIFKYVSNNLSNKKIIDIGSSTGFFSFAAAERGATVDAIEPLFGYFKLCRELCEIYNIPNINFINNSISNFFWKGRNYDYGFMLSVFQWISEGNRKLNYANDILMETSKHIDTLFFELGCNSGKSSVKTKKINHLAYIYFLLKNNTVYKNIKLIGVTKIWGRHSKRYLFICSKENLNIKEPLYSFFKKIWI